MSKIDQMKTRRATVTLTTRVDARYLATLLRFWGQRGEHPRSNSELIRLSIETFAEFLVLNKQIDFVQSQTDALEIMEATGLSTKAVNTRNFAQALVDEEASLSLNSPKIDQSHLNRVSKNPISSDNPELIAAQARLAEELERNLTKQKDDANKGLDEFKKNLGAVPK